MLTLLAVATTAARADEVAPLPGPAPLPSKGCGTTLTLPAGSMSHKVMPMNDPLLYDRFREYFVYVPPGYYNTKPLPVIYSFHGFYSDAAKKSSDDKLIQLLQAQVAAWHDRCDQEHTYRLVQTTR